MKTKIKVIDVFTISNKILFTVNIEGGTYLIGDIYYNVESDIKFKLDGIAMENNPNSISKSISVSPIGNYKSIDEFKGKVFLKEEN